MKTFIEILKFVVFIFIVMFILSIVIVSMEEKPHEVIVELGQKNMLEMDIIKLL